MHPKRTGIPAGITKSSKQRNAWQQLIAQPLIFSRSLLRLLRRRFASRMATQTETVRVIAETPRV